MDKKDYGYKCLNCGKDVEINLQTAKKILCPYCGFRIIEKKRPNIPKKVLAR
ncbi:MAG: DNA-directed RNA polymerase subunit P [Candidatus Aenigmatarchaeota archaeon]